MSDLKKNDFVIDDRWNLDQDLIEVVAPMADTTKDIGSDTEDYYRIFRGGIVEFLNKNREANILRNDLKAAARQYLRSAFVAGYLESSGADNEDEIDDVAMAWVKDRIKEELGYISSLVTDLKSLDVSGLTKVEIAAIAERHAEGYTNTLKGVYNQGVLYGKKNQLLTWKYGDTEHCDTCLALNGKKHKASWYIARDYIPRQPGAAMKCGGHRCQCSLLDKAGNEVTL